MNAVNLIPAEARSSGLRVSVSPPFMGLLAGLALVLVATVLYVTAHDGVSSRQAELARVTASASRWSAAAASYSRDVQALKQRTTEIGGVNALVAQRFDWSRLLGQLAGAMPAQAELSSLQATPPSSTGASASAAANGSSTSSGVQLSACAASQSVVAQTMVALGRVTGVSQVTLSSSGSGSSGAAATTTTTPGACHFPVQFQVSLAFAPRAGASSAAAASAVTQ